MRKFMILRNPKNMIYIILLKKAVFEIAAGNRHGPGIAQDKLCMSISASGVLPGFRTEFSNEYKYGLVMSRNKSLAMIAQQPGNTIRTHQTFTRKFETT
jgi:hypothetical protein